MSLSDALMTRARAYNQEQAAAGVFSVRVPPTGGRSALFSTPTDRQLAEWVAVQQSRLGLRPDGAIGPSTLGRFRWAVLEALRDGSASNRAQAPGWEIFDRLAFPLDGRILPMLPAGSAGSANPTAPALPMPSTPSAGSSAPLWVGLAAIAAALVLWRLN